MNKYALMKRCNHDLWLQVYMYDLMYVDPETIPEEDYLPYTKPLSENYKKTSTPGPFPNHWLGFSYNSSEYYELDMNVYET